MGGVIAVGKQWHTSSGKHLGNINEKKRDCLLTYNPTSGNYCLSNDNLGKELFSPILQMMEWSLREVKQLAHRHTARM